MYKIQKGLLYMVLMVIFFVPVITKAGDSGNITNKEFIQLLQKIDTEGRLEEVEVKASEVALTRENAAVLIVKLLGYEGIASKYKNSTSFTDVTAHKGEIHIMQELGVMSGVSAKAFAPTKPLTAKQAEIIIGRVQNKLAAHTTWKHISYAISSNSQMELIKDYDAVSFGWAELNYDEVDDTFSVSTTLAGNDFKVPTGFEIPLDFAKANGVETYLMIYFENQGDMAQSFLKDQKKSEAIISEIVALSHALTKDGETRSFDGVTIDFEQFYKSDLKEPYNIFLSKLSSALKKSNKKLNVAVQPNTNFKGYDYKGIGQAADKVILMAHDYAPKSLSALEMQIGSVITPITPISENFEALKEITNVKTGISDKTKIALQISYGSTQWQLKAGQVINSKPYTPSYDKIYERLANTNADLIYSEFYQNPYVTYELDGIKNIIWFENNKSVKAKIDLAKLYGIPNVSYWRLGTIPNFEK